MENIIFCAVITSIVTVIPSFGSTNFYTRVDVPNQKHSPGGVCKKVFFKILQNSQENTCPKPCNFIKKRLQHRFFPVKFPKFLRTSFLTEHLRQLLALVETLRLHVNLLLMFGFGEKFSQGILVCMLLSLFSVENNIIGNKYMEKRVL